MEASNEEKKNKTPEKKQKLINKYIDLHFHLDGSIVLPIAKELAKIKGIELESKTDEELESQISVEKPVKNLGEFLERFELPIKLLQTEKCITEAIKLVANNIKSQGVIYVEIRFAPQFHTKEGLTQEQVVKAAIQGKNEASIKVNLILCFMRFKNNKAQNEETLRLANKYYKTGDIVAVDIAGDEAKNPVMNYKDLFDKCKEYGIPYTIHAGEADGAESVKNAINLGAKRIGHGTRAFEDPEVVKLIKEKGIFLEMCPTSNIKTKALDNMDNFPFMNYLNQEIKVTLNTDDMAIAKTTLADEFRYMEEKFGLNSEQEKIILSNSVDDAFANDNDKKWLRQELGL